MSGRTPSQTVGPFFHDALRWPAAQKGRDAVVVSGRVTDGAGAAIEDALLEATQPGSIVRVETTSDGQFRLEAPMPGGTAPHLDITVFARGLLKALRTRVYLAPEERVRREAELATIAGTARLSTLVARPIGANAYAWDIRLQGEGETVFFA
jgi:protocatechuate 3,4-dioxygenase alpha subunit